MSTRITVPILRPRDNRATGDTGGAATIGRRTRKAISEEVASLAIEQDALDQVIRAAVSILSRAISSESKTKNIRVNALSIHVGITAGGSVGILGTGLDVEAEASFEISFHVVEE